MTLPATIRVNVRVSFPTSVKGAAFITVAKSNGIWTISPDYTKLAQSPTVDVNKIIAIQDLVSKSFFYTTAVNFIFGALNSYRIITTTGAVAPISTDVVILFQKGASGSSSYTLPLSSTRGGAPILIKDMTGDAATNNITIIPATGETIDGLSAAASAANGIALIDKDYGSRLLFPLTNGGWYVVI
jgi:hypothetical protein